MTVKGRYGGVASAASCRCGSGAPRRVAPQVEHFGVEGLLRGGWTIDRGNVGFRGSRDAIGGNECLIALGTTRYNPSVLKYQKTLFLISGPPISAPHWFAFTNERGVPNALLK